MRLVLDETRLAILCIKSIVGNLLPAISQSYLGKLSALLINILRFRYGSPIYLHNMCMMLRLVFKSWLT